MIDPRNVPPVDRGELLARYILFDKHIRSSDNTVKPDALIPHPHLELSVTRHRQASEAELWGEGERVSQLRNRPLLGRADFLAATALEQDLVVEAAPLDDNTNHANVLNWPNDKPAQKIKAQEIAASATFAPRPDAASAKS